VSKTDNNTSWIRQMTNGQTILNHYVPQFYLRNFSIPNTESIWCFDKVTRRKFRVEIKNIACERGFYNQETELYLGDIESKAAPVLKKLIDNRDLKKLLWCEREILASFIAIQDNRTHELRDTMSGPAKWLVENVVASMPAELKNSFSEKQLNEAINRNAENLIIEVQEETLKKSITKFSDILLGLQWILLENRTDMVLWTSDSPINKFNPENAEPFMGNLGYFSSGIEIFLPLTPRLCLSLIDLGSHKLQPIEKMTMHSNQNVIYQNCLQFDWARRHIFSQDNNFELAEKILKERPTIKKKVSNN
jgi:hypothetical protein